MKESFVNAVETRDLQRVRLSLSNELLLLPSGESFQEMSRFARERLPDLFEVDNGEYIETDTQKWDKDYMLSFHSRLNRNFSEQKLNHFADVVKVVLAEKIRSQHDDATTELGNQVHPSREGAACVAGGAAIAIAGFIAEATFWKVSLISMGLAGVVYGMYALTKK